MNELRNLSVSAEIDSYNRLVKIYLDSNDQPVNEWDIMIDETEDEFIRAIAEELVHYEDSIRNWEAEIHQSKADLIKSIEKVKMIKGS